MSDRPIPSAPGPILVVSGDEDRRVAMTLDLEALLGGVVEVVAVDSGEGALAAARVGAAGGRRPPVAFLDKELPGMTGVELALAFLDDPEVTATRRVLVTPEPSLYEVDDVLTRGAINGMLNRPWTTVGLREQLRAHLATYYTEHDPSLLDHLGPLVDDTARTVARRRVAQRREAPVPATNGGDDHLLLGPHRSVEETNRRFVAALDRALGHPPRLRVGPGSVLLQQGADVGGIYVVLEGEVELCRRSTAGVRVLHRDAVGPVIGLLSLASRRRAFLEVRTLTEVRAIPLSIGQLERAMAAGPEVGALLTQLLVESLAGRLREADELHLRVDRLAASLAEDRDRLAGALADLGQAQADLIAKARMATLGELAAGVAHELNNPTAAIRRTTDHLADDVTHLLAGTDPALGALRRALVAEPLPAAGTRAARRALIGALGDRALADRLLAAGVTDAATARSLVAADAGAVDRLVAGNRLGVGLRNLTTASARIGELVDSLRAYLRGGATNPFVVAVAVPDTVEDALRLLGHRLGGITVERSYAPVPPITAQPGRLQQVWTNLVVNAVDALEADPASADPTIEVRIGPCDGGVRVAVADNGPGLPPEVVDRLFTPHFTTKQGQVRFGSGLGLSIVRQIVEDHGGTIDLDPGAGRTVFTVTLPPEPPGSADHDDVGTGSSTTGAGNDR